MFNGQDDAVPVRIKDAASTLLRTTWHDVSNISVDNGLLTFRFRNRAALHVAAEAQDIPNLIGLIRAN